MNLSVTSGDISPVRGDKTVRTNGLRSKPPLQGEVAQSAGGVLVGQRQASTALAVRRSQQRGSLPISFLYYIMPRNPA